MQIVTDPLGLGKGAPGRKRGPQANRRNQISLRLNDGELRTLVGLADADGVSVGAVVRRLILNGHEIPPDQGDVSAVSTLPVLHDGSLVDGDPLPSWTTEAMAPSCGCHCHSDTGRPEWPHVEHWCAEHGGTGRRCPRCQRRPA